MEEKLALCRAMAESGRGLLQTVPMFLDPKQQLANIEELGELSRQTGGACSLAPILVMPMSDLWQRSREALETQRARGADAGARLRRAAGSMATVRTSVDTGRPSLASTRGSYWSAP